MTTATEPQTQDQVNAQSLFENTVFLNLSFKRLGVRRKVAASQVAIAGETQEKPVDKALLSVTKEIMKHEKLDEIRALANATTNWLKDLALPAKQFRRGIHVLPAMLIPRVERRLEDTKTAIAGLADEVAAAYESMVDTAKQDLGPLYNPMDYPSKAQVRAAFEIEWQYMSFDIPRTVLSRFTPELILQEEEKLKQKYAMASEEIVSGMRAAWKKLLDHAVERMTPGLDGKRKRLHQSFVTNLNAAIELFPMQNLANDEGLTQVVDQIRQVMSGIDVETLKDNSDIRTYALTKFTEMQAIMDTMVTTGPTRAIDFGPVGDDEGDDYVSDTRILTFSAKCSDLFSGWLDINGVEVVGSDQGYVPSGIGIGGGDYVELVIDLDTGKILNWTPPTAEQLARALATWTMPA